MAELWIIGAAILVTSLLGFILGRAFRGVGVLIFILLMAGVAGLLVLSMVMWANGAQAGMFEALVLIFFWAPASALGLICSVFGWLTRRTPLVANLS